MRDKFILHLPPRNSRWVYYQIFLVMVMFWLRDSVGIPSSITYLTDIITFCLLIKNIKRIRKTIFAAGANIPWLIVCLIVVCMLFGALINTVSPVLVLWAIRNNLRFFAFLFICITVLSVEDIDNLISFIKKFFWINVLMCSYQYFVKGLSGDYIGGFFGNTQGCNAYVNVFLCIVCAVIIGQFFVGKIKIYQMILYLLSGLYIASLAELKIFYVEFIIMLIVALIFARPSIKTVIICFVGIIGFVVGINLVMRYSPQSLAIFTDQEVRDFYLSGNGYTNSGDLNRFTAIQQISKSFFSGDLLKQLFGFGLGSCEYASFEFLQSSFSKQYSYLHYRWFTHAWVYLEQGAVGLGLLTLFIIALILWAVFHRKSSRPDLIMTSVMFLTTCLLGMIYNCALEIEACYLIALVAAIPFVVIKYEKNE